MSKTKFWSVENPLISLKAMIVGIVTMLILVIPSAIGFWFMNQQEMVVVARLIQIITFILGLWIWGYLANKFWSWK